MELDCREPLDVKMFWSGVRFILGCTYFSHNSPEQKNNLEIAFVLSLKYWDYTVSYNAACSFRFHEDAIKPDMLEMS